MLEWAERSRERALLVHGHHKTTLKRKAFSKNALVGNGCQVNGFSASKMTSRCDSLKEIEAEEKRMIRCLTPDIFEDDPESYFKTLTGQLTVGALFTQMQNRRATKWGGRSLGGGAGLLSKIRAKMAPPPQEKTDDASVAESGAMPPASTGVGGGLLAKLRARRASKDQISVAETNPEAAAPAAGGGLLSRLRAKNSEANLSKAVEAAPTADAPAPALAGGGGLLARLRAKKSEADASEIVQAPLKADVPAPAEGGGLVARLRAKQSEADVSAVLEAAPKTDAPAHADGGLLGRLRAKKAAEESGEVSVSGESAHIDGALPECTAGMRSSVKGGWLNAMDTAEKIDAEKESRKLPPIGRRGKKRFGYAAKRSLSVSGESAKLPNIKQNNKVTQSQQDIPGASSPGKSPRSNNEKNKDKGKVSIDGRPPRGFVLSTPQSGQKDNNPRGDTDSEISSKRKKERSIQSAVRMAKARNADGSIPLPMSSQGTNPRPFYHIGLNEDVIGKTLDEIHSARGVSGREKAIETLSKAQSFKHRPWLGQVRQALLMSNRSVRRLLMDSNRPTRSVTGTADTGL